MGKSSETEDEEHLSPSSLDFEPSEVTDLSVMETVALQGCF